MRFVLPLLVLAACTSEPDGRYQPIEVVEDGCQLDADLWGPLNVQVGDHYGTQRVWLDWMFASEPHDFAICTPTEPAGAFFCDPVWEDDRRVGAWSGLANEAGDELTLTFEGRDCRSEVELVWVAPDPGEEEAVMGAVLVPVLGAIALGSL